MQNERRTTLQSLVISRGPSCNVTGPGCNFLFLCGPSACCTVILIDI
jgi:hypothetical protein